MSKAQRELVQAEIETMLRKGAISQIDHTRGICQLAISCGKKDGVSSNKFEEPKFLHALRALQNGKFKFNPALHRERRLHDQAGFEGCLLLRTSPQGISKIYSISMEW